MDDPGATMHPVQTNGFSGARIWRVESAGKPFALRRWPRGGMTAARLAEVHAFQRRLATAGCPVPSPLQARDGQSIAELGEFLWELTSWMPGIADYHDHPTPEKLQAAFQTLATIHNASDGSSPGKRRDNCPVGSSAALEKRYAQLDAFLQSGAVNLLAAIDEAQNDVERASALAALRLASELAPGPWSELRSLRHEIFFLTWCLRDVWHDHILFTGERVTGVIDFGAAAVDTPVCDIARLLGSMAGDDADRRRFAVMAYETIRPLWPVERDAIVHFDSSGVVLSALNWINWLFCDPSALAPNVNRTAALRRLQQLTDRLRVLANRS
jgi:homoserine kinase type II